MWSTYLVLLCTLLTLQLSLADETDTCEAGPWGALLEEWATSPAPTTRQGRIMSLPPTKGYYVTDRADVPLTPPPPPPPRRYDEWTMTPPPPPLPGKIVNRPPNPYKDQFKPSYPPPQPPSQAYPGHQGHPSSPHPSPPYPTYPTYQQPGSTQQPMKGGKPGKPRPPNAVDRVDEPPPKPPQRKEVSETDLYLLGAIEKLVFRVDLMEKRLRKLEESLHYMVAGANKEPAGEPCATNFTRVGGLCYHMSSEVADWKTANLACRKLTGHLVEFDDDHKRKHLIKYLQKDARLKDGDWWTGGLNPGLLWIWSGSARPVLGSANNSTAAVAGDGRCLALTHEAAVRAHVYRGQDCAFKHRYVCEKPEDKNKLSNEISRASRQLRPLRELAAAAAAAVRGEGGEGAEGDKSASARRARVIDLHDTETDDV